ncbi:lysylphosphatidylglycerol synthase domain-containing protein [Actinosynnema sp. NPDC020468]|uniref:lysylphosphatidylglycerol synthase domain-containing protein n=1 Tax=Actinosynnema sp. NPDC020468 TaxID=3154488 RepID=UPI0033E32A57
MTTTAPPRPGDLSGVGRRLAALLETRFGTAKAVLARAWPWVRVVAAVGVLVVLGVRLGTGAVLAGVRAVDLPAVLAAVGIGVVTTVCAAGRWVLVARGLGLALSARDAVADYYRGLLLNAVLPAGVLGDVQRAVAHGRQSRDVRRGVRAVVVERFAGQVVLVAIASLVLATVPTPWHVGPWAAVGGGAAVVGVLALVRSGVPTRALPGVVVLSAGAVAGHVALFLVAARVAGVTAPPARLVPLVVVALLVMAVPINVGGFGPREAFLSVAFGAAGLGAAQGLSTAVGYGVLALAASLPGVVPLLAGQRRQAPPERLDQPGDHGLALAR